MATNPEGPLPPSVQDYKLVSSDEKVLEISARALRHSKTLRTMTELLLARSADPIPVAHVNSATLQKVIEWCEQHKDEEPKEPKDQEEEEAKWEPIRVPDWDRQFLDIDNAALFEVICAANYLDIRRLLDVACKTVAQKAVGKSPEELRALFGIPSDEEETEREKKSNK
ncbi:unnamed protein product [Caenorhabditis sp. 36 PRJEB53466]|nr:unnamed protein product [Caenorhabditis sp. 36 PRJEB53466]